MESLVKVVLIDDSEVDNYLHTRSILKSERGEVVQEFQSAEGALEWFKQGPQNVDIILLDVNMPRMNGFEFLEEYQKLEESLKAKSVVVMLTSSLAPKDKANADRFGVKFENKSLTKDGFINLVESIK